MCGVISTGKSRTFKKFNFTFWSFGNRSFTLSFKNFPILLLAILWVFWLLTFCNFVSLNFYALPLLVDSPWCNNILFISMQEHSLASDDVLAHFFNDFLSLPVKSSWGIDVAYYFLTKLLYPCVFFQSFPEALLYNQETGQFEVVNGAAEFVSRRIRSVLHCSKSQLLTGDPTALARAPPVDNHYTIYVSSEWFLYVEINSWIYLKMSRKSAM